MNTEEFSTRYSGLGLIYYHPFQGTRRGAREETPPGLGCLSTIQFNLQSSFPKFSFPSN